MGLYPSVHVHQHINGPHYDVLWSYCVLFLITVVWNPWDKNSKSMVDFSDEEYTQMLCVDGAAIEKPVTLKTEEEWTGRLQLSVVPSSFCSEYLNF